MLSYREAIDFLHGLTLFGANFGLETTRRLAALAGNPQERLRFIHVAGTNGKGSTCALFESVFRAAGLRVGLFTSPHLVSFAERIQVNRRLIPQSDLSRLVGELKTLLAEFPPDAHPTLFEVTTVLALRYFEEQHCDLVVWETGLGGRLDATNIVAPLASVITNIGWDHQQWLGDTLEKIAAEKAGILKPGVPAVTAATPGRGLEVIEAIARRLAVPLTKVGQASRRPGATNDDPLAALLPAGTGGTPVLRLLGAHQRLNAAVVVATVRALATEFSMITDDVIRRGLSSVEWPGRLQIVKCSGNRTLVLDGAHNPDGAAVLRDAFATLFPGAHPTLLLGMLADKDWRAMVRALAPLAGRVVLAPVSSGRTLDPAVLRPECLDVCPDTTVCSTVDEALQNAAGDPLVLVAGSLYLVGEVMQRLGITPGAPGDEQSLNEWSARRT